MNGALLFILYLLGYAICSGANVGYFAFSLRQLRRQIARGEKARASDIEKKQARRARTIQAHLKDPNWTLAAILLTNVGFGVQLSQLSDSLFTGVMAVLMPIVAITVFGEFFSQATFLRFAGKFCSFFSPFIWGLKYLTAPVSWPLARAVDALLGREVFGRLNEKDLITDLELELRDINNEQEQPHSDRLDPRELKILMNVARADDELAISIAQPLDPLSLIELEIPKGQKPNFPVDLKSFAQEHLGKTSHPWSVLCDSKTKEPRFLLDGDGFVRDLYCRTGGNSYEFDPLDHIFRVRIYNDPSVQLGPVVSDFKVHQEKSSDEVIDIDVVLIWTDEERWILTGGDILGRFLRGVPRTHHWRSVRAARQIGRRKTGVESIGQGAN